VTTAPVEMPVEENERLIASSFRFHRDLESFAEFCRREWRPLLFFGLGFSLLLAATIVFIDESFFYSRVQTDALWYFLKGRAYAETGNTAARIAVNLPTFIVPSMPGVIRAPFIRALSGFDSQLRGIQLANILVMDSIAVMSAYVVSWVIPRTWHSAAIAFSFAFSLMAPWWMQNVFMPLADAPYAALSLASMLIGVGIVTSPRPARRRALWIAFAIVFAAAFAMRFSEPVVLILVGVLALGRFKRPRFTPRLSAAMLLATATVVALVLINRQTFFYKYLHELSAFALKSEGQSLFLNLVCLAIPQQIIPAFDLGFSHPPILHLYTGEFARTRGDAAWSIIGFVISSVVIAGVWQSRKRLQPEIWMLLVVLPALVLMMPSTPRYLMTYQAFFWIWFYEGALLVTGLVPERMRMSRRALGVAASVALAIGLALGFRSRGLLHGIGARDLVPAYIRAQTGTYRPLERFMETLPRNRAILVTINPVIGRWTAIAGLDYYFPDSVTADAARKRDMYVVLDCGSRAMCETLGGDEMKLRATLSRYGRFDYQPVFEASARKSRAMVYRVRVSADSSSTR
jgi:hypothetical protein